MINVDFFRILLKYRMELSDRMFGDNDISSTDFVCVCVSLSSPFQNKNTIDYGAATYVCIYIYDLQMIWC